MKIFNLCSFDNIKEVFISMNSNSRKYYIENDDLASKEILIIKKHNKYYINYKNGNINYRNMESIPKKVLLNICEEYSIKVSGKSKDIIVEIIIFFKNKKNQTEKHYIEK